MFILANLLIASARVISIFLTVFWWLLLIRVLISWVSPNPFNPLVQFIYRTTDPVLDPIRRMMPSAGMIDFSPIVAFVLIVFLQAFLVQTLVDIAHRIR